MAVGEAVGAAVADSEGERVAEGTVESEGAEETWVDSEGNAEEAAALDEGEADINGELDSSEDPPWVAK